MRKKTILLAFSVLFLSTLLSFWELGTIDLEGSEDIYVSDSVGYLRHDPFMVPRHHLRKPHAPASPHPFFVQLLTTEAFRLFGLSLTNARIVQATSIVVSTGSVMLLGYALFRSSSIALFSGLVFTTFPLILRFGKMAVLDPVLGAIQVLGMLWLWYALHKRGLTGYLYSFFVGFSLALSISTKLTGIFFIIPIAGLFTWKFLKSKEKHFIFSFSTLVLTAGGLLFLLNDPYSYIFGWTNFSDPKHQNISIAAILKSLTTFRYWYLFVLSMLGIAAFFSLVYAIIRYRYFWKNSRRIFLVFWIFAPLSYLLLNPPHVTGLSSEWSYIPLFLPLSLVVAKTLIDVWNRYAPKRLKTKPLILYFLYIFSVSFPLVWYGLRFRPLPFDRYQKSRNVVRNDLAITKIVTEVNKETKDVLVLIVTKRITIPLWLFNDNVATEPFYSPIEAYDYIVTDNLELVEQARNNHFVIQRKEKNPSEPAAFLLANSR